MNALEAVITIAICIGATMLTRYLPFLVFSEDRPLPAYVEYLGRALPAALFAFLVVYCLKDVDLLSGGHGVPEAIAIAATALIHVKWRRMILSIVAGTLIYMVLVRVIIF